MTNWVERAKLDEQQREKLRMIQLHCDNGLVLIDGLPRHLQLRAMALLLERFTAKLLTMQPK